MARQLAIVFFRGVSLTDTVSAIGNSTYSDILVSDMPGDNPQFFLGQDLNGAPILCTVKTTEAFLVGSFASLSSGDFNVEAELAPLTVQVDFIGGRPDDRR